jgi:hypothetical protein
MNQDREITRDELHQLVWSKPTSTVAKEFGLSDVGLAKICRKLGVKKPPRGYWAKAARGMRVSKPRLGALPHGCVLKTVIRGKTEAEQIQRPSRDEIPVISIRENLQGCSRLITATRLELGKLKPDKYGMLDVRQKVGCLSIAVSETRVDRTLVILDTLIREFEKREMTVIPAGEEKLSQFVVGSENIRFYVREQSKQTIDKSSSWDRHIYSPKGKLSFVLDSYSGRAWHDGKEQRLEALLGEIVVGTFQLAEVLRADRLEREERLGAGKRKGGYECCKKKHGKKKRQSSERFVRRSSNGIFAK